MLYEKAKTIFFLSAQLIFLTSVFRYPGNNQRCSCATAKQRATFSCRFYRVKSTERAALLAELPSTKSYFSRPMDYTEADLITGCRAYLSVCTVCHIIESAEIGSWEIYFHNFL